MVANILGMDPLTFALALLSVLGCVFSTLAFLYYFSPSRQVHYLSEGLDQAWDLTRNMDEGGVLSRSHCARLYQYLEGYASISSLHQFQRLTVSSRLQLELASLMLVSLPSSGICQTFRAWKKTWKLIRLSIEIRNLNLLLLVSDCHYVCRLSLIYSSTLLRKATDSLNRRVQRASNVGRQGDVQGHCSKLRESLDATISTFTAFLEGTAADRVEQFVLTDESKEQYPNRDQQMEETKPAPSSTSSFPSRPVPSQGLLPKKVEKSSPRTIDRPVSVIPQAIRSPVLTSWPQIHSLVVTLMEPPRSYQSWCRSIV